MNTSRRSGVSVGGSSILVIFVLLCLTTFATLSLVSANADFKLTAKTAMATKEYYEADAKAVEILALIDGYIKGDGAFNTADFTDMLSDNNIASEMTGDVVSYYVPVNERQELRVTLRLVRFEEIERMQWKVVNVGGWSPPGDGFNLWGGNEDFFLQ